MSMIMGGLIYCEAQPILIRHREPPPLSFLEWCGRGTSYSPTFSNLASCLPEKASRSFWAWGM